MQKRLWLRTVVGFAFLLGACVDRSTAAPELDSDVCAVTDGVKTLDGVPEASGLALSRRTPGVLWSHNDSGQPVLFAFAATGEARGRVRIPNATVEDWEDVTTASCPGGTCLYVADIGDNDAVRRQITIYRIPEPQPQDQQSAAPQVFVARYPDGPRDAEALFVVGDDVYILTKDRAAALYRFPRPLRAGSTMTLERIADLPLRMVTDAETSADGAWVTVRTNDEVLFYRPADLVKGSAQATSVSLQGLKEPQGEGVALDGNGTLYLTSEAGGERRGGSLVTLRCRL